MKCIHCGSDTKYPDRQKNGGRCTSCQHLFAFEPKTDTRSVSDPLFERIIKDVSANNTLSYTEGQLWYEFNRRLLVKATYLPRAFGWGAGASFVGGAIGAVVLHAGLLMALGIAGAIGLAAIGTQVGKRQPRTRYVVMSLDDFRSKYLNLWRTVHGEPVGLLAPEPLGTSRSATPSRSSSPGFDLGNAPPDLTAYSFDRALVCESADVAAMLIANRFHFENNCAILSADRRFPERARFDAIVSMLARNPNLFVFVLHDASPGGVALSARLRQPDWFPDAQTAHLVDLGLHPRNVTGTNLPVLQASPTTLSPEARAGLSSEEVAWLESGNIGQVEALRPARIMRAIYQGFSRSTEVGPDGAIIFVDSGPSVWVYDSGVDVVASDSFG